MEYINIYRTGSLRTAARELGKDRLDLVGVEEIRRNRGGAEPAGDNTLFYGNGNENHGLGDSIFCT
jgi:hypothetical protein